MRGTLDNLKLKFKSGRQLMTMPWKLSPQMKIVSSIPEETTVTNLHTKRKIGICTITQIMKTSTTTMVETMPPPKRVFPGQRMRKRQKRRHLHAPIKAGEVAGASKHQALNVCGTQSQENLLGFLLTLLKCAPCLLSCLSFRFAGPSVLLIIQRQGFSSSCCVVFKVDAVKKNRVRSLNFEMQYGNWLVVLFLCNFLSFLFYKT